MEVSQSCEWQRGKDMAAYGKVRLLELVYTFQPKVRTPRAVAPPIDVTEPRQRNNGNIEVINSEFSSRSEEKMSIDELLINGRRYRVPERIIVVDFWNKVRQQEEPKTRLVYTYLHTFHLANTVFQPKPYRCVVSAYVLKLIGGSKRPAPGTILE